MAARNLIQGLESRLSNIMDQRGRDIDGWVLTLPQPTALADRVSQLAAIFEEGTPAAPPSQARINALDRLRQGKVRITRKDWSLICWGLCDDCGQAGRPIESDTMFGQIMQYANAQMQTGISRKIWFGLLHSYFAYQNNRPEDHANWRMLRSTLARSLASLVKVQRRPKAWATVLHRHQELLSSNAGKSLGAKLLAGDDDTGIEVATYLPIPETSWLWRKVISAQLALIDGFDSQRFKSAISPMLALARKHVHQADEILSRLLDRYEQSELKKEPHAELKQFALEQWQNPQLKSANRWSLVGDGVRKMILEWIAKEDLMYFFSLLQGRGGVDQARLRYWLRFADKIHYTRIVMGSDAYTNDHQDFVDYRLKNQKRLSRLVGGVPENNAFIMGIGAHYFVEFSGTGNACYIYEADNLPFNPEIRRFQLGDLKTSKNIDRILHLSRWQSRADLQLRQLGIVAPHISDMNDHTTPVPVPQPPVPRVAQPPHFEPSQRTNQQKVEAAISRARELAKIHNLRSIDNRSKGGAFWVSQNGIPAVVNEELRDIGFNYSADRGYWIE